MSEFKGTPGPWLVGYSSPTRAEVNTPNSSIADVWNLRRDANHIANAHLIAAAPDLLDALRLVREDIAVAGGHDNYCAYVLDKQDWRRDGAPQSERPPCNCWQADAVRKIDAAIAKALNTDTKGEGHE